MLAAKVAPVIEQVPRRVCAPGLRRREKRFCAVPPWRAAGDVVLRGARIARRAAAAERRAGYAAVDFEACEAGAVATDRKAFFDCAHIFMLWPKGQWVSPRIVRLQRELTTLGPQMGAASRIRAPWLLA